MGSYLVCVRVTSHSPLSHVGGHMNKKASPKRHKVMVYKQKNINLVLTDAQEINMQTCIFLLLDISDCFEQDLNL